MKYVYRPQVNENLASVYIPNKKIIFDILSEKSHQITSSERQQIRSNGERELYEEELRLGSIWDVW